MQPNKNSRYYSKEVLKNAIDGFKAGDFFASGYVSAPYVPLLTTTSVDVGEFYFRAHIKALIQKMHSPNFDPNILDELEMYTFDRIMKESLNEVDEYEHVIKEALDD